MNTKKIALKLSVSLLCALSIWPVNAQGKRTKKPNVLVIYTDDHRFSGVHSLKGMQLQTPHMDALAADGISFSNGYLMGSFSGATCIPSRAMLLTGRNLFELQGHGQSIPEEHTTMGEAFMKSGYYAYHIGKWHQDLETLARSFNSGAKVSGKPRYLTDQFRMPFSDWKKDGIYKEEDSYLLEYDKDGNIIRRPLTEDDKRGPTGTEKTGPHVSEVLADEALGFFQDYRKKQPFFMYLAFPTPHDPRQAPQKYKDLYPVEDIILPPSYMAQHPFDNGHMVLRDEELAPWPRTPEIAKQELSDYYAIISHLDAQLGKVIAALKESGAYANTLIVFAGDSGLAVGNHGLLGKQNIYDEDGVHIPLIFSGNLIKDKGSKRDAFVYNFDIFPTIYDIIGMEVPNSVTGKSLLPIIKNEQATVRDYTYHAYKQFQRAYRKGAYKLIEYVRAKDYENNTGESVRGSRVTQLFNIAKDPWEVQDLSFFPEYREKVQTMRNEMKEKAKELGDSIENIEGEKYDFWEFY
ncbi:sulfatase-like hydrolase/transferase [Arenibacter sp. F20364]|uniref:sulfatase-like hydrolase/transferase n=1 Tax=Arenibacter sp. F20364 TaxID=2926415 RepID=UPI001FF33BBD|nr:sulfatase-like hydrolase/transferase [Arenibacter sp. F20364]MCK0188951.1 sulfatase-like hydrolase/transferase [Arenibacter sp. F20364]